MSRRRSASRPLRDEGAVEALERHHVRDRAERDEVEISEQIGLGPRVAPEAAGTQLAVHRHDGHEHQADGGEMAEAGEIVEPVGIDHRERGRKRLVGEMMIDHDHVEAEPLRFGERLVARGAAIDGDEERGALRGERAHRVDVGTVAFEQPVGNVDERPQPGMAQEARQRRGGGRAIDIVVAEDRDRLAAPDGVGDARGGGRHVGQHIRIGHQRAHGRIEEGRHVLDLDSAPGQDARQKLGHVLVALRNRERARLSALVEPVAPGAPARRVLDAEKQAPAGTRWWCHRDVHHP